MTEIHFFKYFKQKPDLLMDLFILFMFICIGAIAIYAYSLENKYNNCVLEYNALDEQINGWRNIPQYPDLDNLK